MAASPLSPDKARKLARTLIDTGKVVFTGHALAEMEKDDLTTPDALNTIRAGVCEPAELETAAGDIA